MKPKLYIINTDASIEPSNPGGIIGWAFIARLRKGPVVCRNKNLSNRRGDTTSNQGEYMAVMHALLWLLRLPEKKQYPVIIKSDSQLIVNQCSGQWQCKDAGLKELLDLVREAVAKYPCSITFKWIPRSKNTEVDDYSRSMYSDPAIQAEIEEIRKAKFEQEFGDDDVPW